METNKNVKPVAPFDIAIIDLIDAYHYADFFDPPERYAWIGWREYAKFMDYELSVAMADRLFWALNPADKTQSDWTELEAGYDVRIYDANHSCVYKAHEKLPKN